MFETAMKILSVVMGFALPPLMIKAVRASEERSAAKYTTWASCCLGVIVFTIMGLL